MTVYDHQSPQGIAFEPPKLIKTSNTLRGQIKGNIPGELCT